MKIYILLTTLIIACNNPSTSPAGNNNQGSGGSNDWLIPQNEVFDGGPGKDGIPAISDPNYLLASEVDFLNDDDLVIGFSDGQQHRAYPHQILDWHEIINDDLNGLHIAVTYCPLTGTGIGWSRVIEGQVTTFGVSGLLYNSNLIPYDRLTDSNWCQISYKSVNGDLIGEEAQAYYLIETTWKTWKKLFPNSSVVSRKTGFARSYGTYPYGDYKTNNERLLFPISRSDDRVAAKERVLALVDSNVAKVYRYDSFEGGTKIVTSRFVDKDIVVIGNKEQAFMVAFENNLNGSKMTFSAASPKLGGIVVDAKGNLYDLFGYVLDGPDKGSRLKPINAFMAYYFSISPFYGGVDIFTGKGQ